MSSASKEIEKIERIRRINRLKRIEQLNQINRIKKMEENSLEVRTAINNLSKALEEYENILEKIKELDDYYSGDDWLKDYDDDTNGIIPKDLERGVLSQDFLYNLLEENKDLLEKIRLLTDNLK